jgi:hypothetical protein
MALRWLGVVMVLACGDAGGDGDPSSGETGSTPTTSGASMSTSSASTSGATTGDVSTSSGSSESTDGENFDLSPIPDASIAQGCEAVDFLFVIDDSSSMAEHQQNLVDNFPAFIDGIESTLGGVESYQVGVIATDAYPYNPGVCILMGALVTSTEDGGPDASNMVCGPYAEGFNFMTQEDDLESAFSCAAQVGTMGNGFERPMEAMVDAVSKTHGDPGECNEGFLRDEALLVIVVITDEYDGEGDPEAANPTREPATSLGTPQTWYDAVLEAKGGHEENAVALGILNYEGGPCPPADLGHDGRNIVEWVEHFGENGFLGGLCEEDYEPFFDDAIGVIEEACANFVPTG